MYIDVIVYLCEQRKGAMDPLWLVRIKYIAPLSSSQSDAQTHSAMVNLPKIKNTVRLCHNSSFPPVRTCLTVCITWYPLSLLKLPNPNFPPPPSFSPLTLNLNLSFSPAGDGVLFCSFFSFLPVHSNFEDITPFSFVPRALPFKVRQSFSSLVLPSFFFFCGFTLASTRFHPETSVFCGLYHLRQVPDDLSAPSLCFIFFRGPIIRLLTVFARLLSSPPVIVPINLSAPPTAQLSLTFTLSTNTFHKYRHHGLWYEHWG